MHMIHWVIGSVPHHALYDCDQEQNWKESIISVTVASSVGLCLTMPYMIVINTGTHDVFASCW